MPMTYLNDAIQETIFLEPVTLEEIRAIVSSLKNNATGFDEINAEYLKMSMAFIANPLVYICNMSFSEGVFPTQLKIANVVPLYKCDDPMLFNHYQPVSLLCILSKVFEKVMYNRLIKFLEKISIVYEYQFGFRRKRSTHFALITLIDKLTQAIENGEYVKGVFLDFSKAFDTVNHEILRDWSRSGGSYVNNTQVICCPAPGRPCALRTSRRRTTNHSGVVAVTPSWPWSIPIITWLNNVI